MSGVGNARVRDYIHSQAEIRAVISLPTHTFVQSGVPTVNTCILYVQKFTVEKKAYYDAATTNLQAAEIRKLIRSDAEFDYSIFMGTAEFVGFEPSGRSIIEAGEKTDLDLLRSGTWSGDLTLRMMECNGGWIRRISLMVLLTRLSSESLS